MFFQHPGIDGWLASSAERLPHKAALIEWATSEELTYSELDARVDALAAFLDSKGIRAGERVALISDNSLRCFEAMFAVWRLGAIVVPLNHRLARTEIMAQARTAGVRYVFAASRFATYFLASNAPDHLVLPDDSSDLATRNAYEAIVTANHVPVAPASVTDSTPAVIMFTSGTTGTPKGAVLTHGNFEANIVSANDIGLAESDTAVVVAPLFHIGGLNIQTLPLLKAGGTSVVLGRFDAIEWIRASATYHATIAFAVPSMWMRLQQVLEADYAPTLPRLPLLRIAISGGAPCPDSLIESLRVHDVTLINGFGLTETSPIVSCMRASESGTRPGSVGKPSPGVAVKIIDDAGRSLPAGQRGELLVKAPTVFSGYWQDPEATSAAFDGEWFRTGDLAQLDSDNFLYIVGRKKDVINTGGENVAAAEVEAALAEFPEVTESAVIGVPDERWGERIVAYVVGSAELSTTALHEFMRATIAHFKAPKEYIVIDALPLNGAGKIDKSALRARYSANL